jgi:hypothetical protein
MEKFAQAVLDTFNQDDIFTTTENGGYALKSTGQKLLDLFGVIGSLRNRSHYDITSLFDKAFSEDALLAMKMLFYARNIRGGLGERNTPKIIFKHVANTTPDALRKNLHLIQHYGRWDDYFSLVDTQLEDEMWNFIAKKFKVDLILLKNNEAISLLGKWMPTPDTSSNATRKLARKAAKKLNMSIKEYTKNLRELRKALQVVETKMSCNEWEKIEYSTVPSKAMMNYRNAFPRHDEERFSQYVMNVQEGKEKVNSSTLYPYDIFEKMGLDTGYYSDVNDFCFDNPSPILEEQWKALPNYIEGENNIIVMADTSGSMNGRPICTSLGLAMYFAERNKGAYKDLFMTFSSEPKFVQLKGNTLEERIKCVPSIVENTDLRAAFELVLKTAIDNDIEPQEMPKSIIVVSDMEIDYCSNVNEGYSTFYDIMKKKYKTHGYDIPNVTFWNVASRNNIHHASSNIPGVQMVSGQSISTFKAVLDSINKTPIQAMIDILNDPAYDHVTI